MATSFQRMHHPSIVKRRPQDHFDTASLSAADDPERYPLRPIQPHELQGHGDPILAAASGGDLKSNLLVDAVLKAIPKDTAKTGMPLFSVSRRFRYCATRSDPQEWFEGKGFVASKCGMYAFLFPSVTEFVHAAGGEGATRSQVTMVDGRKLPMQCLNRVLRHMRLSGQRVQLTGRGGPKMQLVATTKGMRCVVTVEEELIQLSSVPLFPRLYLELQASDPTKRFRIDSQFLKGCVNLDLLDLSKIAPQIVEITDGFMAECRVLTAIKWGDFSALRSIGKNCFHGMGTHSDFSLQPFSNATSLGNEFMYGHEHRTLAVTMPKLQTIGDGFVANGRNLTSLDLFQLASLTSIGDRFCVNSAKLRSLDLSPCQSLQSIGNSFANRCVSLELVNLENLRLLRRIGTKLCFMLSSLTSVRINGLKSLEVIETDFCTGCMALKSFEMHSLPHLREIKPGFLTECKSLEALTMRDLPSLRTIGNGFIRHCPSIERLVFEDIPRVTYVGLEEQLEGAQVQQQRISPDFEMAVQFATGGKIPTRAKTLPSDPAPMPTCSAGRRRKKKAKPTSSESTTTTMKR